MPLYQAVVLAIVQGLTEFLPVSSTAHLWIVPWILKWNDPGLTFDVALHAGTLVAVLLYFWRYWLEMIKVVLGVSRPPSASTAARDAPAKAGPVELVGENRRLFWFLVIATIPGGIAGYLFEHAAEEVLRTPFVIGSAMIIVGLVMWAGDRVKDQSKTLAQIGLVDSVLVGVAQAFAVIPGVSRSGSTMAAGLFRGMKRETAARFSFLLATPLIAGACLKKGMEIHHTGMPPGMHTPFIVGAIVSGLVGYAVIAVLIRFLESRNFTVFVVYRLILGVILLAVGWGLRH